MILSCAPTRITLGGGGTDLKSYYAKHGGFLIAGAINKYCNVLANKRFYPSIRLSYSEQEIVDKVSDIRHPIFKAALELSGISDSIELHSTADVPANCGLGASSSFTVALMNALHAYKREFVEHRRLAEEACHIEIDMLGEPIGKQDQYSSAFGGLTCFTFSGDGYVEVEPLHVSAETIDQLESNLLLFFTGKERKASEILAEQDAKCKQHDKTMEANLHKIKQIGLQTKEHLERGEVDELGALFHEHWLAKKKRSDKMTDPFIDECYELALKRGAMGGKLCGSGGGGFLMLYCENAEKARLVDAMRNAGLRWERFRFDFQGARILVNT